MTADDYREDRNLPYRSRIFHHIPGLEKLSEAGDSIFLPENHYLLSPGDEVKYCYFIKEGRLITLEITEGGEEHFFNIFDPGSLIMESNLMANYEADIFVQTLAPTELVRITKEGLIAAMREDEKVMQGVFDSFASKYYSAMDQLREIYNHSATWKVYNMLLRLAEASGKKFTEEWTVVDIKITQQFICSMLGLNRITVNRAVKELREEGKLLTLNAKYCVRSADVRNI